jgi:drug/metabolite transporter (DMT)-like permease
MTNPATAQPQPTAADLPAQPQARLNVTWIVVSLLILYVIWGTTYLGIAVALESFPPYLMMGIRFMLAGSALFLFLVARRARLPTVRQWRNAAFIGGLLLAGGMGSTALAEQSISSGLVATLVATAPLWAMLFNALWGNRPRRFEWFGVILWTNESKVA